MIIPAHPFLHIRRTHCRKLYPSIPYNIRINRNCWENSTIPRICFSPSIQQCILGLQLSESEFKCKKYLYFYVYTPTSKFTKLITNKQLIKKKYVFDAHITGECWILEEVKVTQTLTIKIYSHSVYCEEIEYTPLYITNKRFLNKNGKLVNYKLLYEIVN